MKHILSLFILISPFLVNSQENKPYTIMLDKRTEILTGKKAMPHNPQSLPTLTQEVDTLTTELEELRAQLNNL